MESGKVIEGGRRGRRARAHGDRSSVNGHRGFHEGGGGGRGCSYTSEAPLAAGSAHDHVDRQQRGGRGGAGDRGRGGPGGRRRRGSGAGAGARRRSGGGG